MKVKFLTSCMKRILNIGYSHTNIYIFLSLICLEPLKCVILSIYLIILLIEKPNIIQIFNLCAKLVFTPNILYII